MYHNIEKRRLRTLCPCAAYRGWDASGRFWYVTKLTVRGKPYFTATLREAPRTLTAGTLREISEKLTKITKE